MDYAKNQRIRRKMSSYVKKGAKILGKAYTAPFHFEYFIPVCSAYIEGKRGVNITSLGIVLVYILQCLCEFYRAYKPFINCIKGLVAVKAYDTLRFCILVLRYIYLRLEVIKVSF